MTQNLHNKKFLNIENCFKRDINKQIALKAKKDINYFSLIYEKYFEKLYKYFYFILRSKEHTEKLISITFDNITKNLHKYKDNSFSLWVFNIAHTMFLDYIKRNNISLDQTGVIVSPRDTEFANNFSVLTIFSNLIKFLSTTQKEVLSIKFNSELSNKDIASILGLNEPIITNYISESIKKLKSLYEKYNNFYL